jgi:hypothetical protein
MTRFPDSLAAAALAYLAAPSFVFLLTWLQLPLGLATAALLATALYQLLRRLPPTAAPYTRSALLFLVILAFVWAALGGAGHFVYANSDWRTRDAVYGDLILSAWPPEYGLHDGVPLILRTAMGYYLPPALLSKLAGTEFASLILFGWTALGVALFLLLLPLPKRLGWRLILHGFLVVFFSGMDWPAIVLVHGQLPIFPLPLEWWRPWTYTSLTGQLFWAPNHALALWLGTALFYRYRANPILPVLGLVLLPLLLLWTPFAVIGLLPWFLWGTLRAWPSTGSLARGTTAAQWVSGAILTAVVVSLFTRPAIAAAFASAVAAGDNAVTKAAGIDVDLVAAYVQFVAFEFGLLVLLLRPRHVDARQALAIASGLLLLLPLAHFGPSNDWVLRVSTPSLLVLLCLALAELDVPGQDILRSLRLTALVAILVLGAITPVFEISRAILWPRTPPNYGQTLVEQQAGFLAPHYLGKLDLATLRAILKTPALVPAAADRQRLLPPSLRRPPS